MLITTPYYEDNSRISNSNIGQYIKYGPRYLKNYLDGKEEGLKGSFLEKGSMIHMYILQPDEFWKEYEILDFDMPSGKQKAFLDAYQKSDIFAKDRVLEAYRNTYSNSKTDTKAIEEGTELIKQYAKYIEYLEIANKKKVISFADLQMLKKIKSNLESHKKANELLYNLPETCIEYNEFHINWTFPKVYEGLQIECKSLLDRLVLDHEEKKIMLIDIKTTSHINEFKESMETFDYYRQLAYYWMAIHWLFKNELNIDIEEYTYESYIIAISNNGDYQTRVFKIEPETIENRIPNISKTIEAIAWHKTTDKWDYSKEYYEGDGAEKL